MQLLLSKEDGENANCHVTECESGISSEELNHSQISLLTSILEEDIEVKNKSSSYYNNNTSSTLPNKIVSFPSLKTKLKAFIKSLRHELVCEGIRLVDIRMNGGAASYVISDGSEKFYNDVDLLFFTEENSKDGGGGISQHFDVIKCCVFAAIYKLISKQDDEARQKLSPHKDATTINNHKKNNKSDFCRVLKDAYIQKMVKITNKDNSDAWSLFSFQNVNGKNIEFKFVISMLRQFEFSVDSFQIILDPFLNFDSSSSPINQSKHDANMIFCNHDCDDNGWEEDVNEITLYPRMFCESAYGDFHSAYRHLKEKIISTKNPEAIRGGGLLKYCELLAKGYSTPDPTNTNLERYMCSRFFIDFNTYEKQCKQVISYIWNHFKCSRQNQRHILEYLAFLKRVIAKSALCIMHDEKYLILSFLDFLFFQVPPVHQHHFQLTTNLHLLHHPQPGIISFTECSTFLEKASPFYPQQACTAVNKSPSCVQAINHATCKHFPDNRAGYFYFLSS